MTHEPIDFKDGHRIVTLTKGERIFLRYYCQDMPIWEIAKKMGLSPRTIDSYRDNLFKKLRIGSMIGLVLWCIKIGFFKKEDIRLKRRKRKPRSE